MELVAGNPDFSNSLSRIGIVPGLEEALAGPGPFTAFAPPNSAIASVPQEFVDNNMAAAPDSWVNVENLLLFHTIGGVEADADDLSEGQVLPMLNGGGLTVSRGLCIIVECGGCRRHRYNGLP